MRRSSRHLKSLEMLIKASTSETEEKMAEATWSSKRSQRAGVPEMLRPVQASHFLFRGGIKEILTLPTVLSHATPRNKGL